MQIPRISLVKCVSILVASGYGDRCNVLCSRLRQQLLQTDPVTGLPKVYLHKYGKQKYAQDSVRISKEVGRVITPLLIGIPDIFYGPDKPGSDPLNQN